MKSHFTEMPSLWTRRYMMDLMTAQSRIPLHMSYRSIGSGNGMIGMETS